MLIPRDKGGVLLPHMVTASPKATYILAIHFLEKTFVKACKSNTRFQSMPKQRLFGLTDNRMGQLFQTPALDRCARGFTNNANEDGAQGFRADMAVSCQLSDCEGPGEVLLKKNGRFS